MHTRNGVQGPVRAKGPTPSTGVHAEGVHRRCTGTGVHAEGVHRRCTGTGFRGARRRRAPEVHRRCTGTGVHAEGVHPDHRSCTVCALAHERRLDGVYLDGST